MWDVVADVVMFADDVVDVVVAADAVADAAVILAGHLLDFVPAHSATVSPWSGVREGK